MRLFPGKIMLKNYVSAVLTALSAAAFALPGLQAASAADIGGKTCFPPAPAARQAAQIAPVPARPYRGICRSFFVRAEAKQRFARQMRHIPYEPQLYIKAFSNVAEVQYQRGPESYNIDRVYCTAAVIMNNGQSYPATYSVARNQGFAGIGGQNVSFCVAGFDKWLVRDNDCRSLRAPIQSIY